MHRIRTSIFACVIAAVVSGCAAEEPVQHDHSCHGLQAPVEADPLSMPQDVVAYLATHHHNHMHLDFHVARMWDRFDADTKKWATDEGISRWRLQEGAPTTGLEFLAMHRLMIDELRKEFPQYEALFAGWDKPPTDPRDPANPLPNGATDAFDPDMLAAIDKLQNDLSGFASDDDFALFLQTKSRPSGTVADRSAGMHNYLHNRFADDKSPITVGDPSVNLNNQVFWRIHGWVDSRWTAYRKAKGLDDTDPTYQAAMSAAQTWMDDAMARSAAHGKTDDGCEEPVPDEVKSLFAQ